MKKLLIFLYAIASNIGFGIYGSKLRLAILRAITGKHSRGSYIGPHVTIVHPENFYLGDFVSIHKYSYIDCAAPVSIGAYVSIAHDTSIISFNHTYSRSNYIKQNPLKAQPITIEDDCWIGCKSIILSGVCIKNRTIVAAGAVVSKSNNGNEIIGGIPAKHIKNI